MWKGLAFHILFMAFSSAVVLRERPTIHEHLSKKELSQIFGTENIKDVPVYQLGKVKRHVQKLLPTSLKLNAFGVELRLNLSVGSEDLLSHGHTIEFYGANGKVEKYHGAPGEFAIGTVYGENGSHVALHHNDQGVTGTVRTKKEMYFVHPLPSRLQTSQADHLIYRKSEIPETHPVYSLGCHMKDEILKASKQIVKRSTRTRRATNSRKTIELMVAADYTMVKHYSKLFLPSYLLATSNIVAGLFKDVSLESTIDIRVIRTVIFETDVFKAESISDLLSKFHSWVALNNDPNDAVVSHVDNAMLLTKNGCTDGCGSEGLAYGSLCGTRAQAVTKDRGLMSALTFAHELAHNLGVGHDTSEDCPDGLNIMSTGAAHGTTQFQWSKCSSNAIRDILASPGSTCMDDVPAEHKTNSSFQLYGQVYDVNEQCRMSYGDGYSKCSFKEVNCLRLSCQKDGTNVCYHLLYPPVQGTPCGEHQHCIQGVCLPDGTVPQDPIDGQWGAWSEYTPCNRPCGIGVQWRTRECDNPAPKYGGSECVGSAKGHFKTCNTQECPEGTPSFRLQQCQNISSDFKDFYDAQRPCQLVCGHVSNAYYYGTVLDATLCHPGKKGSICIQGECKGIGCDLELESGNVVDRCGVCKGLGNTCELVTGTDMNTYGTIGQYHLVNMPVGSTNIKIKELGPTLNFLGFKIGTSENLAITLPTFSVTYYFDGVPVYYNMEGYQYPDEITIMKPLPEGIRAYMVNLYQRTSQGVEWTFYKPIDDTTEPVKPVLMLIGSDWGTCSKTCGGGIQTRPLICLRQDDNSTVSILSCEGLEGPPTQQACNNFACPAQWHVSSWSECTKSCGNGTQSRQLYCSKIDGTGKMVMASETDCSLDKPEVELTSSCNEVICPAFYEYGQWSQCSASCNGGKRTRSVACKHIDGSGKLVSVNALACNYLSDPVTMETCNVDVPCPEWKIVYSECSKTCGGGVQTPSVACYDPQSGNEVNENTCDGSKKITVTEEDNKKCNEEVCDPYIWRLKKGVCSVTCGNGLLPTTVICFGRVENIEVDNSKCSEPKPATPDPEACDAGACPETYSWKTKYSACSVTCGDGVKNLEPYCVRDSDQVTVQDIFCDASNKPSTTTSPCAMEKCPIVYLWKVEHAQCSVTCGRGVQKVLFKCYRENDKVVVDNSKCDLNKKPVAEDKDCLLGDCPPTYSWNNRNSSCSVTCGNGVITQRTICRRDSDGTIMDDSFCDASRKPADQTYACALEKCKLPYFWRATHGKCIAECGAGYRLKMLSCIERSSNTTVVNDKCMGLSVPQDEPCNVKACEPVFKDDNMPPVYGVGCYNDQPTPRRVPIYLGSLKDMYDPENPIPLIQKCAEKAHSMGYLYFSTQFYGECWAGDIATAERYYLNGPASNCVNGIGGDASNFVYKIGSPEVLPALPAMIKLGCYKDDIVEPRPLPSFLGSFRDLIVWKDLNFDNIVTKCAQATRRRNWNVFGIQYYGECWSGENSDITFNRAGESNSCLYDVGEQNANFVYAMIN